MTGVHRVKSRAAVPGLRARGAFRPDRVLLSRPAQLLPQTPVARLGRAVGADGSVDRTGWPADCDRRRHPEPDVARADDLGHADLP